MLADIPVNDARFRPGRAFLLACDYRVADGQEQSVSLYRDIDDLYYLQYTAGPIFKRDDIIVIPEADALVIYDDLVQLVPWEEAFPDPSPIV